MQLKLLKPENKRQTAAMKMEKMKMRMILVKGSVGGEKSVLLIRIQGSTPTVWLPSSNSSLAHVSAKYETK